VILSDGAINSPQLLLLSDIGPGGRPARGQRADQSTLVRDVHNHVAFFVKFNDSSTTLLNRAAAIEYLLFRDGLISDTGISEVTAVLPS